jgi:dTDP-glucose 4,6-dehydratase
MKERFLVFGSNSFSGSHFVKFLIDRGHQVVGISRSPEPDPVFLPYRDIKKCDSLFRFHALDLNRNGTEIEQVICDYSPEYFVNFAAQGMVAQSWEAPADWYQTNVVAQVRLHECLRKLRNLKKYVHVTTPEVYGSTDGWITESDYFLPSTPYAVSRASCDMHLMSFFHAYNFPVVFTRAANVYGPGQQLYRIIPRAMMCARTGDKLELHGGGSSVRCFIHIVDVAKATYEIALRATPGESFHISTRQEISIRRLVERIAEMTQVNFYDLVQQSDERLGKDEAYLLDSSKLREQLDWQDQISLQDGLTGTLEWIDQNQEHLKKQPQKYIHKT